SFIAYLLSEKARWVTGQTFTLDGGHSARPVYSVRRQGFQGTGQAKPKETPPPEPSSGIRSGR
ncbi:MAG: hypothetical protein LBO68_05555, partial [Synergistaceae bacterium]|nr:hypothetical protein [Synergistaceae bacterium]